MGGLSNLAKGKMKQGVKAVVLPFQSKIHHDCRQKILVISCVSSLNSTYSHFSSLLFRIQVIQEGLDSVTYMLVSPNAFCGTLHL